MLEKYSIKKWCDLIDMSGLWIFFQWFDDFIFCQNIFNIQRFPKFRLFGIVGLGVETFEFRVSGFLL